MKVRFTHFSEIGYTDIFRFRNRFWLLDTERTGYGIACDSMGRLIDNIKPFFFLSDDIVATVGKINSKENV